MGNMTHVWEHVTCMGMSHIWDMSHMGYVPHVGTYATNETRTVQRKRDVAIFRFQHLQGRKS